MRMRTGAIRFGLVIVLLFAGMTSPGVPADSAANSNEALLEVRRDWLPTDEKAVYWHWLKDRAGGPALTGSQSWRRFLTDLEAQFAATGVIDLQRNEWTFDRWTTSYWPDDSQWFLTIDGSPVEVAQAGANSGSTGPDGLTASLVLYDPDDPPQDINGKIVVFETHVDSALVRRLEAADYEYHSPWQRYPEHDGTASDDVPSQSWRIFPQLMQTPGFIDVLEDSGAAGALFVFDGGREQMAGMYTFPVPDIYDVPTLILDRQAGQEAVKAARANKSATLRLKAKVVESQAWQLIGYLPGRDYGTPEDEVIQLTTHTDGPSISQDNGALGLLGLVRYMSNIPRVQRPRTLMVFLDCRHFMPGQEEAFEEQNFFTRNPQARNRIVGVIGMEHLGQIEYVEKGNELVPSGRVDPSLIWTTNNDVLVESAIKAVKDNELASAYVRNVERPGIQGHDQGQWYGMASFARDAGLPAFAIMGTMGAYWATSSGVERFDPTLFRRQVATFAQLTGALMVSDLEKIQPAK